MANVTPELKKQILAMKPEDLTVQFILSKVSKTTKIERDADGNRKGFKISGPEWDLTQTCHLKAHEYINEKDIDTTLGSILFNKLCIENRLQPSVPGGFYNEVVTNKSIAKLLNQVVKDLMDKKIQLMPNVTDFIRNFEFYGMMLCAGLSPSLTPGILSVQDEVRDYRDKLFAEVPEGELDAQKAVEIEDKVLAFAKEKLKDDPGMTLFDSGSRGSFNDNYKMMSLTVGPIANPATGGYDIVKSNYIDGITKKELPAMGNCIVNGAYPKAVGTADGGYITKQFYAVFQGIKIDEDGSDCGSHGCLTVFMTDKNYGDYMWQYAMVNGKPVLMDSDNQSKFMNKLVKVRTPMGCIGHDICNICAGERFKRLGIDNAGLTAGRLPNSILNAGMKSFHVTKVEFSEVDPDALLI